MTNPARDADRIVGDTLTPLLFALEQDGTAVDLTGKTVAGEVYPNGSNTLHTSLTATVTDAAAGQGYLTLNSTSTGTAGEYYVYVTVTSGGKTDHYPAFGRRWMLRVHAKGAEN